MPEGRWPRVTPCPKSGAAAESARLRRRRNDREELPTSEVRGGCQEQQTHARSQGLRLGGATPRPHTRGLGPRPGRATQHPRQERRLGAANPCPRPGAVAGRSYPTPEARCRGRQDQPQVQGVMAAWAQEGLEELSHVEGQEGRR